MDVDVADDIGSMSVDTRSSISEVGEEGRCHCAHTRKYIYTSMSLRCSVTFIFLLVKLIKFFFLLSFFILLPVMVNKDIHWLRCLNG